MSIRVPRARPAGRCGIALGLGLETDLVRRLLGLGDSGGGDLVLSHRLAQSLKSEIELGGASSGDLSPWNSRSQ